MKYYGNQVKYIVVCCFQAPAFVFVDEIDAIAGRHARKDPRRRAAFDALVAQLDGELVFYLPLHLLITYII